jgi:hypothetical protein
LIRPGEIWPDDRGQHVQAHGGGIIRYQGMYYWFGEYRGKDLAPGHRAVSCYTSPDLVHWTFKGLPLNVDTLDDLGERFVLERPKVFYNAKTRKFVMYLHVDSHDYKAARVGVATADAPEGPYVYLKSFRPLGEESRDIGQFVDDDGTAYLIFEDRPHGFHIARLSDDYLTVERDVCLIAAHMEGGALVHYDGLYYCIGSHLTGWNPNPNQYATAERLEGPWSEWKDVAPPQTKTYGSQSTMMIKVVGSKATTVVFMADVWKPKSQWDSRYLWMPAEIGNGKLWIPTPQPWTLDVETGEAVLVKTPTTRPSPTQGQ